MPQISPGSLLLILVIVLVIFGTKKLRGMGSDLGGAVKGFRSAMDDADGQNTSEQIEESSDASFDTTPVEESEEKKDA